MQRDTVLLWSDVQARRSVVGVPKIRAEDRQFALRLGNVLFQLRTATGETQEVAAERMGLNAGTYGRWERGDYAPKGYDLGRLYRGYLAAGAEWQWFFDPPETVTIDPVRARLDELSSTATSAADAAEARAAERRRQAASRRADARGKRTK